MTPPKSGHEEYLIKEEQERLQAWRAKLDKERLERQKREQQANHWMKCPKCGDDLKEQIYRDIKVDVCGNCNGLWLDDGELELLLSGSSNVIGDVVKAIRQTFKNS